jgi:ABC-type Fe3+/spermidine/putrescine transport system ATPase subunit
LEGVSRSFGEVKAVDALSLSLERGEFLTLLGPSGCGKTTALRMIAGFEVPNDGRIYFDREEITRLTPQRRGFGMVFQNYALFPHLNVFENVAFGLRARNARAGRIAERVQTALEVVDLEGYAQRAVQELSGGQQQRVALARAIAIEPPLLLLDEPLSNLDQALRIRTRTELRRLVKELGITAIFVTHDQEEAFDLADRIAVMRAGRLHQVGTPQTLYEEPADRFVAEFVGRANTLPVVVRAGRVHLTNDVDWPIPVMPGAISNGSGVEGERTLVFRPEELSFVSPDAREGSDLPSPLDGIVRDSRYQGGGSRYSIELSGNLRLAGPPDRSDSGSALAGTGAIIDVVGPVQGPRVGDRVSLLPRAGARLHLFPR